MNSDEELEFVGWTDHQGYVWKDEHGPRDFYEREDRPYTLRPTYAVKSGEKKFGY